MKPIVVVIGGAGGIGSSVVGRYVRGGCEVIVGDVAAKAGQELSERFAGIHFEQLDVLDEKSITAFAQAVQQRHGSVTHLVSLAGRAMPGEFGGLAGSSVAMMEASVRLNLTSHVVLTKLLLPLIEANAGANRSITFVSSINAIMDFGLPAYSAAKAGLLGFVRSTATELGAKGIRVNAVLPGSVDTPMTRTEPKDMSAMVRAAAMGRIATADEIAEVTFAVTEYMTCVTGQHIVADCGQSVKGHR